MRVCLDSRGGRFVVGIGSVRVGYYGEILELGLEEVGCDRKK